MLVLLQSGAVLGCARRTPLSSERIFPPLPPYVLSRPPCVFASLFSSLDAFELLNPCTMLQKTKRKDLKCIAIFQVRCVNLSNYNNILKNLLSIYFTSPDNKWLRCREKNLEENSPSLFVGGSGYLLCCRRWKVHTKAKGPNSANSCPLVYKLCILHGHPLFTIRFLT